MARKPSFWKHKKYKQLRRGSYGYNPKTGRVFCLLPTGQGNPLAFESHEAAKAAGWEKVDY